jgi:hypothetical protein
MRKWGWGWLCYPPTPASKDWSKRFTRRPHWTVEQGAIDKKCFSLRCLWCALASSLPITIGDDRRGVGNSVLRIDQSDQKIVTCSQILLIETMHGIMTPRSHSDTNNKAKSKTTATFCRIDVSRTKKDRWIPFKPSGLQRRPLYL